MDFVRVEKSWSFHRMTMAVGWEKHGIHKQFSWRNNGKHPFGFEVLAALPVKISEMCSHVVW
jgi:hypothetical protein